MRKVLMGAALFMWAANGTLQVVASYLEYRANMAAPVYKS